MRKFLLILLVILVVTPVALYFVREPLIKMAINNIGSSVAKTEVSVSSVNFKPFSGFLELKGLTIANPEGYSQNNAIEVAGVRVRLDPKSLMGNAIKIQEVTILEPKIRMEGGLKTNNLTTLQKNLPQTTEAEAQASAPENGEAPKSRAVEIDVLQIENGVVEMAKPIKVKANLGTITVRDIGKAGSTATVADVFSLVMNRILSVGGTVISGEIGQQGRKALQKVNDDLEGAAEDVGKKIGKKLKGLFGN